VLERHSHPLLACHVQPRIVRSNTSLDCFVGFCIDGATGACTIATMPPWTIPNTLSAHMMVKVRTRVLPAWAKNPTHAFKYAVEHQRIAPVVTDFGTSCPSSERPYSPEV